jgi:arylsulfatase
METFAGYTAQTDFLVGRILDTLGAIGQTDNTLIFWEIGDNGASMEGTLHGAFNEMVSVNGEEEDPNYILAHLDEIGGPKSYNHYPVGWAWAMDTPFQWGKQIASHFGGTRNPLVISWPNRIKDKGGIRTQFHHVIDLAPTILEAAGIEQPSSVNGVAQKPIEGVSMVYSFDDPKAAEHRRVQYFEMFGNRAIYSNGWVACVRHGRLPWENVGTYDFDKDKWELYRIDGDFSEANDLAAREPQRLRCFATASRSLAEPRSLRQCSGRVLVHSYFPSERLETFRRASGCARWASRVIGTGSRSRRCPAFAAAVHIL